MDSLKKEIVAKRKALAELRQKMEWNEELIREQRETLSFIRDSISWNLVERFRGWHESALPIGTKRQRLYTKVVEQMVSLLSGHSRHAAQSDRAVRHSPMSRNSDHRKSILIHCDEPMPGRCYSGILTIRGWAWAPTLLENIHIDVNGIRIGEAVGNIARPDIQLNEPRLKNSQYSGFSYIWDTTSHEDGVHELTITASTRKGRRALTFPILIDQAQETVKYHLWINSNEPDPGELEEFKNKAKTFSYQPLFSIVVPSSGQSGPLFEETIASVQNQVYENWELRVISHCEKNSISRELLRKYSDRRIIETEVSEQDASVGSVNVRASRGDFVCILKQGDTISPDALYSAAEYLQEHPDIQVIYSDEDELDLTGERSAPFFKPDWSPDLLLSMNYLGNFLMVRRELMRDSGGLRNDCSSEDFYDFALRLWEKSDRIGHIARVLYHRRSAPETAAKPDEEKVRSACEEAAMQLLKRNRIAATVEAGIVARTWRVHYSINESPRVTIIIPAGPRIELLRTCLNGVFAKTDYKHFDVLVMDNSKEKDVQELLAAISENGQKTLYVDYRKYPFNFSAINNYGVRESANPLVVFLNDDIEVLESEWLTALVEHGQRPQVGVVGAKLLYPDGLIQHAGVIMGIGGYAGHAFKRLPAHTPAHFNFAQVVRNCSAVTAACMLTKRKLFLDLGGFNETDLSVAFQDPDYCLRVRQAGFLTVYTPYCTLVHRESASRGTNLNRAEVRYMQRRWAEVIAHDPYYNPNLTRDAEDFSIRL